MSCRTIKQFISRWYGLAFAALGVLFFTLVFLFGTRELILIGESSAESRGAIIKDAEAALPKSPLTGLPCENAERRPLAVMLAADPEARPLSGIQEADVVIEMPVTMNQITRFMALYQCADPAEIGSVRSARHDFLPLAAGFDAVYAHWGGSHFALDKLRANALDNIDALLNPFSAYWRKDAVAAPHNGFTGSERLWHAAAKIGYASGATKTVGGFQHREGMPEQTGETGRTSVEIPYGLGESGVRWEYEPERGLYRRLRGGRPERDRNTNADVEATAVIVMRSTQTHLEAQYTDVKVVGGGSATIYQGGAGMFARWQKQSFSAPLRFIDESGADILFLPGKKWIEIVTR